MNIRNIKELLKKGLYILFQIGQIFGIDILPRHYYSSIPNLKELKKSHVWREPMSLIGINQLSVKEQVELLNTICTSGLSSGNEHAKACALNGQGSSYGVVESEFLYCFIKRMRPPKIIQVGCGVSTAVILSASEGIDYSPDLFCIEPFPSNYLQRLHEQKKIELIPQKCQDQELNFLTDLSPNDLFFVDSTHAVRPGGEVNQIILEVLPRLNKGIWIHFHDIMFPYDYQRQLLIQDFYFWNESTLLHAFLIGNQKFQIKICQSQLHYEAPNALKKAIPIYLPQSNDMGLNVSKPNKHFPSSTYLKTE